MGIFNLLWKRRQNDRNRNAKAEPNVLPSDDKPQVTSPVAEEIHVENPTPEIEEPTSQTVQNTSTEDKEWNAKKREEFIAFLKAQGNRFILNDVKWEKLPLPHFIKFFFTWQDCELCFWGQAKEDDMTDGKAINMLFTGQFSKKGSPLFRQFTEEDKKRDEFKTYLSEADDAEQIITGTSWNLYKNKEGMTRIAFRSNFEGSDLSLRGDANRMVSFLQPDETLQMKFTGEDKYGNPLFLLMPNTEWTNRIYSGEITMVKKYYYWVKVDSLCGEDLFSFGKAQRQEEAEEPTTYEMGDKVNVRIKELETNSRHKVSRVNLQIVSKIESEKKDNLAPAEVKEEEV